jgi:hypothetical protein
VTRIVIYLTIFGLVAYDLYCVAEDMPTISAQVRTINAESGWLIALGLIVLWLHWFGLDVWNFLTK